MLCSAFLIYPYRGMESFMNSYRIHSLDRLIFGWGAGAESLMKTRSAIALAGLLSTYSKNEMLRCTIDA